jgi:hypothetical protein
MDAPPSPHLTAVCKALREPILVFEFDFSCGLSYIKDDNFIHICATGFDCLLGYEMKYDHLKRHIENTIKCYWDVKPESIQLGLVAASASGFYDAVEYLVHEGGSACINARINACINAYSLARCYAFLNRHMGILKLLELPTKYERVNLCLMCKSKSSVFSMVKLCNVVYIICQACTKLIQALAKNRCVCGMVCVPDVMHVCKLSMDRKPIKSLFHCLCKSTENNKVLRQIFRVHSLYTRGCAFGAQPYRSKEV